jgi:hypothetical protein
LGGESLGRLRLGEVLLHLGDRAGARAQLEEALELAHISPLAQHLLFLVYGVLLQVPEEGAEALTLIERAETLFDPRSEGNQQAAADAVRRAAEGYTAAGQLLNERRVREALERIDGPRLGRFREGASATLPACT